MLEQSASYSMNLHRPPLLCFIVQLVPVLIARVVKPIKRKTFQLSPFEFQLSLFPHRVLDPKGHCVAIASDTIFKFFAFPKPASEEKSFLVSFQKFQDIRLLK